MCHFKEDYAVPRKPLENKIFWVNLPNYLTLKEMLGINQPYE